MDHRIAAVFSCLGLLLLGHVGLATSRSCPALSINIKAPAKVRPAGRFSTKVAITNQGPTAVHDVGATVHLPIQATVVKVSPGVVVPVDNPWTLVLPARLTLGPGKSETIIVTAVVAQGFQGSLEMMASVSQPSDPTCAPVEASRTVRAGD